MNVIQIEDAAPPFPRSTAFWWFGCRSMNRGTLINIHWRIINNSYDKERMEHRSSILEDQNYYVDNFN